MQRLIKIQQELVAPKEKSSQGERRTFNYRSAEDILAAVKQLLDQTQTAVVLSDEIVEVGGRIFLRATASLKDKGYQESAIASASGWAELDSHEVTNKYNGVTKTMSNEQATGCASSYARKYALCGLFAIDDESQDPDRDDIKPTEKKATKAKSAEPQPAPPAHDQQDILDKLLPDILNAQTFIELLASIGQASGTQLENSVRREAAKRGIEIATTKADIEEAYSWIKDREGWENVRVLAVKKGNELGFCNKKAK